MKNPEFQKPPLITRNTFESISAGIEEANQSHSRGEFLFSLESPLAHGGFPTIEEFREFIFRIAAHHGNLSPEYISVEPSKSNPSLVLVTLNYQDFYAPDDEVHEEIGAERREDEDQRALEEAALVELDPNLPQDLKALDEWPKGVPNFDLRSQAMIFQLGDLPCYAGVGPESVFIGDHQMMEVYMLWTDPAYRRKGLGRQMVNLLRRRFPRLTAMPVSEDGIEFAKHLRK